MRHSRFCSIESLEARSLFSASPAEVFRAAVSVVIPAVQLSDLSQLRIQDRTLVITGTHKSDNIVISRSDAGFVGGTVQKNGSITIAQGAKGSTAVEAVNVFEQSSADATSFVIGGPIVQITANGHTYSVSASQFDKIIVSGGDGNDTIRVAKNLRIPTILNGGTGNDTLEAGRKTDILNGNAGDDVLLTSFDAKSYNRYRGGDGKDTLFSVGLGTATQSVRNDIETLAIEVRPA